MWHEARKQEKKIRGMMVDYKRRAERRRDFYEKIKQDPAQFLQVHGRPAKIHLDPSVALAADSPATMMPWQGHADNLIDRFDVRAHLDIIPDYKPTHGAGKAVTDEDRTLFYESYRTLVQNDFLGVKEDKFLHQIFMEERFGIFKPSCEEEKKRLMDKKAAIGYVYEDSTESPPRPSVKTSDSEDDEDKEDDLSDLDLDVTVDVSELTPEQCAEMNKQSLKYGMVDDDFITYLLQDKEEADQLRLAREIEEEKAMYSGRKSRRERRALREKKLAGRKITSPPSYAARDSPTYTPMRHSASKSRSRSPPDSGKIMFITTFGDDVSDGEKLPKTLDKAASSTSKHGKSSSKNKENVIGPQLPLQVADEDILPSAKESSSKRSSSSESSKSYTKKKNDSKSQHSEKKYRRRSKSRSRSRSSSLSPSSKKGRSSSKKHYSRTHSRTRSRSHSRSSSRSRSRSKDRSKAKKSYQSRSKSRGNSHSRSRSRSKSVHSKSNFDKSESPKLPPPPVKSYYRHSLSRSNSDVSYSSDDDDKSSTKSSYTSSYPTSSRLQHLMGKAASDTKSKLTPQERLKRKMQLQLKKQYKADKKAQMEKTEKQLQEQQDRAEELREMAIKLRQRERERRHRMRGYMYDSDSDSTGYSRSADLSASDRRSRKRSKSSSSLSSEGSPSPPRSRRDRSRSPSSRTSRRSPVSEPKSYRSSRRTPPRHSSPRKSPSRSYHRSPPRNSHSSSYGSREVRRASPRRNSPRRSPPKSSKQYRHDYSHSRSRSPVSKSYSTKPLVDY